MDNTEGGVREKGRKRKYSIKYYIASSEKFTYFAFTIFLGRCWFMDAFINPQKNSFDTYPLEITKLRKNAKLSIPFFLEESLNTAHLHILMLT